MSKRTLTLLVTALPVFLGILLKRRRSNRKNEIGRKKLWWMHQYGISPDLPETLRQWELSSLLKHQNWDPTIIATGFNHKARRYVRPVSLAHPVHKRSERDIPFIWLYSTPYNENDWRRYVNMLSFFLITVTVGSVQPRPDVVIGTSPHLFTGLASWILAKRHHAPFVLEIQDLWPESLVQLGLTNPLIIGPLEALERFLYSRADLIVALTEGIEAGVREKGFAHKNIAMISNAAMRPAPLDPAQRLATRNALNWNGKTVAIWIGAHGPANGLDVIVDSAHFQQQHPSLHFVFVGDGPEKARLRERARNLPNVEFIDSVPKDDVDGLLRAADIGLLVHRDTEAVKGARPNKLFDYMAAGLPIVLNMDGEARRLAEEAGAGIYVPAENALALSLALEALADSRSQRNRMGLSGYDHVSTVHSREKSALVLNARLRMLLTERSSTPDAP